MERFELGQHTTRGGKSVPLGSSLTFWTTLATVTLALWLGGSLLLDLVVMPCLYWAGMMTDPAFMEAGALLFGVVNRVELVLAGLTGASLLAIAYRRRLAVSLPVSLQGWVAPLGMVLLAIALIETYGLTPYMVSLGATFDWPETLTAVPAGMDQLHGWYFALEAVKVMTAALILGLCARDRTQELSKV